METETSPLHDNPIQKVAAFYEDLLEHYGSCSDREIRVAVKLLRVALGKFRLHGGPAWMSLIDEYVTMTKQNPEKFDLVMKCQRGQGNLMFAEISQSFLTFRGAGNTLDLTREGTQVMINLLVTHS